jgi:hypothetical protein
MIDEALDAFAFLLDAPKSVPLLTPDVPVIMKFTIKTQKKLSWLPLLPKKAGEQRAAERQCT